MSKPNARPGAAGRTTTTGTRASELHLHFHGVTAEELTEILARVNREDR